NLGCPAHRYCTFIDGPSDHLQELSAEKRRFRTAVRHSQVTVIDSCGSRLRNDFQIGHPPFECKRTDLKAARTHAEPLRKVVLLLRSWMRSHEGVHQRPWHQQAGSEVVGKLFNTPTTAGLLIAAITCGGGMNCHVTRWNNSCARSKARRPADSLRLTMTMFIGPSWHAAPEMPSSVSTRSTRVSSCSS